MLVRGQRSRQEPGDLQHVHGEQHHLQQRGIAAGAVELSDAVAHWWVLDDDHRARRQEAALWASTGHVAAVYGDELYDILPQTRGGYGRLQDFGIRFGYERVVLHLHPHGHAGRLQCNAARTLLLLDHEPLPWARWGEEFTAVMPAEILQLQERAANADCLPRREAIRNRISAIMPLYRLSRYRPAPPVIERSEGTISGGCEPSPADTPTFRTQLARGQFRTEATSTPTLGEQADDRADRTGLTDGSDSEARREATVDLPDVAWISTRDGSRAPGDLEDQAARYHPGRHELTINADFRAIGDLIAHWRARYRAAPGAQTVIAHIREWCEQILVEVVLAAGNSSWSREQLDGLLSPTSFTAALLPRQLLHATLQKRLGQKLGAPHNQPGGLPPEPYAGPRSSTRSHRSGLTEADQQTPVPDEQTR